MDKPLHSELPFRSADLYMSKNCTDMEGTWPLNFLPVLQPFATSPPFISVQQWHQILALHPGAWAFVLNLASVEGHIFFLISQATSVAAWIGYWLGLPVHEFLPCLHIAGFSSYAAPWRNCFAGATWLASLTEGYWWCRRTMRRRVLQRGPMSPCGMAHLQHGVRLSVRCCGGCRPWIYSLQSDITLLLDFCWNKVELRVFTGWVEIQACCGYERYPNPRGYWGWARGLPVWFEQVDESLGKDQRHDVLRQEGRAWVSILLVDSTQSWWTNLRVLHEIENCCGRFEVRGCTITYNYPHLNLGGFWRTS